MTPEPWCKLCHTEDLGRIYTLGNWLLCRECYHIALWRLDRLEDIILAPQDEFDEYLNEILHIMFRKQVDAHLGFVKE